MAGLQGMNRFLMNEGIQGLANSAGLQTQRENAKTQLESAQKATRNSTTASTAATGATIGYTAGAGTGAAAGSAAGTGAGAAAAGTAGGAASGAGTGAPGTVLSADESGVVVACGEGALRLVELQKPGSRRMPVGEFLRGFPVSAGERFDAVAA